MAHAMLMARMWVLRETPTARPIYSSVRYPLLSTPCLHTCNSFRQPLQAHITSHHTLVAFPNIFPDNHSLKNHHFFCAADAPSAALQHRTHKPGRILQWILLHQPLSPCSTAADEAVPKRWVGAHLWSGMAGDQAGQLQRLTLADGVDPLRVALLLDVARQA